MLTALLQKMAKVILELLMGLKHVSVIKEAIKLLHETTINTLKVATKRAIQAVNMKMEDIALHILTHRLSITILKDII